MTREEFRKLCDSKIVILDGAAGTNLQKRGMPEGVCPEEWALKNPDVIKALQKEFVKAGSDILYAPTFSGNRIKFGEYGLTDRLEEINMGLVALSKEAVKEVREETGIRRPVYIAGDLTMTGIQVQPVGPMAFEELVDIYKEQVKALEKGGADLIIVETMMSLQECRAAVLAVKEVCDLPVMVTLTFAEDGRTLFGSDPVTASLVLSNMGVDAVGVNCSTGPDRMADVVRKMTEATSLPVIAKPNAGIPELVNGETVYPLEPDDFAEGVMSLIDAGADIIGGCCGSTPQHIEKMVEAFNKRKDRTPSHLSRKNVIRRALSTERNTVPIDIDGRFMIIGERINPTGKKKLQERLKAGDIDYVGDIAESEVNNGADFLDVNMGMNGIDEMDMMLKCVNHLTMVVDAPLCIDSSDPDVIEAALRIYPGRALINSISLEEGKCEKLLPAARKYGAMFILLPVSRDGLPKTREEKKGNIREVYEKALAAGLTAEDIVVDGLVATIGAEPQAAKNVFDTVCFCKNELGIATACGLSNISFGLPDRMFVNSAFMAMAIEAGLTMAIANPSQELLMHAMTAADLLMNKPGADLKYINRTTDHKIGIADADTIEAIKNGVPAGNGTGGSGASSVNSASSGRKSPGSRNVIPAEREGDELFEYVVRGKTDRTVDFINKKIDSGNFDAKDLLDNHLIPAINQVGDLFDRQIFFLPQLIQAAEAMSQGVKVLEPYLTDGDAQANKGTVIIATVEHDIHDIGKNLVALMLKNYGYNVINLGKNVPSEEIIRAAKENDADIIGLSALMTTTMMEMKNVIKDAKEAGIRARIMIGGAAVTAGFAREIGADAYSSDAQNAVSVAARLMNGETGIY